MSYYRRTDPIEGAKIWGLLFACVAPWIIAAQLFGATGVEVLAWSLLLAVPAVFVASGLILLFLKIFR